MPTLRAIFQEAAEQEGLVEADLMERHIGPEVSQVRRRALWAVRELRPDLSLTRIGMLVDRDHSAVLVAIRQCREQRAVDPIERAAGDRLIAAFGPKTYGALGPKRIALIEAVMSGQPLHKAAAFAEMHEWTARSELAKLIAGCGATLADLA